MSEKTTVSGSISVHDGKERVAYELMRMIAHAEAGEKTKDRYYYLRLMHECVHVINGNAPAKPADK
jgi:hypothetical protein